MLSLKTLIKNNLLDTQFGLSTSSCSARYLPEHHTKQSCVSPARRAGCRVSSVLSHAAATQIQAHFLLWKVSLYTPHKQEPTTKVSAGCWVMPRHQHSPQQCSAGGWTVGNPQLNPNTAGHSMEQLFPKIQHETSSGSISNTHTGHTVLRA